MIIKTGISGGNLRIEKHKIGVIDHQLNVKFESEEISFQHLESILQPGCRKSWGLCPGLNYKRARAPGEVEFSASANLVYRIRPFIRLGMRMLELDALGSLTSLDLFELFGPT